jgi:hypothetical protein
MEEAERLQSTRNRIGRDRKNQSNQLTIASVIMEEVERGGKKTGSALFMVTVSAANIVERCKRNHPKNRTNQLTIASVIIQQVEGDVRNKINIAHYHCLSYEHSVLV